MRSEPLKIYQNFWLVRSDVRCEGKHILELLCISSNIVIRLGFLYQKRLRWKTSGLGYVLLELFLSSFVMMRRRRIVFRCITIAPAIVRIKDWLQPALLLPSPIKFLSCALRLFQIVNLKVTEGCVNKPLRNLFLWDWGSCAFNT